MIERKKIKIYWNTRENTPIILNKDIDKKNKELKYLTFDLRPVFLEEKHLLYCLFPELGNDIYYKSVWANKRGKYFIDGVRFEESLKGASKKIKDLEKFSLKIEKFDPSEEMKLEEKKIMNKFILFNKNRYNDLLYSEIEDRDGYKQGADPFIRELLPLYKDRLIAISFSGGKDSIVVSHLVRKILNNQNIIHIFGDTTLELPNTYKFIEKFKESNKDIPFLIEKNDENNFFEICRKIGPPSRVKSWCCSIFKTGPMGTTFSEIDEDILMFYGVRRNESTSRSKYLRVTKSPKINKQLVASPIIDWFDIDIWLYILTEKLEFNNSYRQGFSRVGCWCCPNNSTWSDFLNSIYISKENRIWKEFLYDFSKSVGKKDFKEYVDTGKWKARQGGAGLDISKEVRIKAEACVTEENSKNYKLLKGIDDSFFEFFKPFGKINFEFGNKILGEVFILDNNNNIIMKLIAKQGKRKVRITIVNSNDKYIFSKIENQLRKFNTCIYCKACNSSCPVGAISVTNNRYYIDEKKCIHCLKCISHFDKGCLISSALLIKNENEGIV